MTIKKKPAKTLDDLFEHGLRDMYYAEKKVFRSLPAMIKAAKDDGLRAALNAHRTETEGHIETLEAVFEDLGLRARGEKCDAIDGILDEAKSLLEDFGDTPAGDAAIIFSAQAVEHYEITRYGSLHTFAIALGHADVASQLAKVLAQEKAADQALTVHAETCANGAALARDLLAEA